jgi:hypothetical protein
MHVADASQQSKLESREEDKPLLQLQACSAGTEPPSGPPAARRIQRGGHPPGKAPCSSVTAESPSRQQQLVRMWRHEATRKENGEDRGRDRDHTDNPPARQRASHLPHSRALPPTHHGSRPRAPRAGPWPLAWRPAEAAARGPRVRRRAADGWIQSKSGAAGERARAGFRFRNLLVARGRSGSPIAMSYGLLDLPCF